MPAHIHYNLYSKTLVCNLNPSRPKLYTRSNKKNYISTQQAVADGNLFVANMTPDTTKNKVNLICFIFYTFCSNIFLLKSD